jgi:hypothetical protein
MRVLAAISFFILTSFIKVVNPGTSPVNIKGHIKPNPEDTSWGIKDLCIFVKGGNKVLAKAVTNTNGDFKISFTPKDEVGFDFYCTSLILILF